jgi:hypothetical protein
MPSQVTRTVVTLGGAIVMLKITFTFVDQPGEVQVEAITVRSNGTDSVAALQDALAFVQGVTTIPVAKITIEKFVG